MGIFDFGDRATVQLLAYRVGVCFEDMEDEIRKSPANATPQLKGLAHLAKEERKKMMNIATSLSNSSIDSLKVEYKREKIPFRLFLQKLIPISFKVKELTGTDTLF